MKLGFAVLDSSTTLNSLKYIDQARLTGGDTFDLYLQLIDLDAKLASDVFARYMPSSAATMTVNFFNTNNSLNLSKPASMAFPLDDRSIWKVALSSADTAKLTSVTIKAQLVDGTTVKTITASAVLVVDPASPFRC
jgi:hypothetical protein